MLRKASFWENVKRTLLTFSAPTVAGLHEFGAADKWVITAAILSMIGGVISIWAADQNHDGIIDIAEKPKEEEKVG